MQLSRIRQRTPYALDVPVTSDRIRKSMHRTGTPDRFVERRRDPRFRIQRALLARIIGVRTFRNIVALRTIQYPLVGREMRTGRLRVDIVRAQLSETLLQRRHAALRIVRTSGGGLTRRTHRHVTQTFATGQRELVLEVDEGQDVLGDYLLVVLLLPLSVVFRKRFSDHHILHRSCDVSFDGVTCYDGRLRQLVPACRTLGR